MELCDVPPHNGSIIISNDQNIDPLPKIKINQKTKTTNIKNKPGSAKRSKPDLNSSRGVSRQTRQKIRKHSTSLNRTLNKSTHNNNINRKNK